MILNHKYKFIFLHIPKTGGTSVVKYFFGPRPGDQHRQSLALLSRLDDFRDYYAFTFVRNPFDRVVSMHRHYSSGGNQTHADMSIRKWLGTLDGLSEFVSKMPHLDGCPYFKEIETMVMPQVSYVREGVKVHSFDNLKEEIHSIATRLGFPIKEIPHEMKSSGPKPRLSDEDKRIITSLYSEDFALYKKSCQS